MSLDMPVLGWKVGRIPAPMVATLGTERLAGPVLRCTSITASEGEAPVFRGGAGAIEAEVILRLDAVPDHIPPADRVLDHIGEIRAGFEVASSPAPDVHDHSPWSIIADLGINNGLLLGPLLTRDEFDRLDVATVVDGAVVGSGRACDILDGPLGSVRFLIEQHLEGRIALEPGQWLSAGAITGVHPIRIGETATATFGSAIAIGCTAIAETGLE
ncbi:2-keto-4-pentenoate hydratase [Sphingopyxis terrae]|nr:2-keto-4-pentenoate hydratase [Sphingopyxis terrae]